MVLRELGTFVLFAEPVGVGIGACIILPPVPVRIGNGCLLNFTVLIPDDPVEYFLREFRSFAIIGGRFIPVQGKGIGIKHFGQSRSEEHTSELQSLMRISYAVFCLKKKTNKK